MSLHVHLDRPWLSVDLGHDARVLSWALHRPGFQTARHVTWREVRNADLPQDFAVERWMPQAFDEYGAPDHVGFLTSRDVTAFNQSKAQVGETIASCVATVGLSNAEAIGTRLDRSDKDWGTINILVHVNAALSEAALIETLSIAASARTAAVMSVDHVLPTGLSTGTGTDCIAVAAHTGHIQYAGMHTDIGEAVGRAVFDAVSTGAQDWMQHVRRAGVY